MGSIVQLVQLQEVAVLSGCLKSVYWLGMLGMDGELHVKKLI
jgi:hypothetical protein